MADDYTKEQSLEAILRARAPRKPRQGAGGRSSRKVLRSGETIGGLSRAKEREADERGSARIVATAPQIDQGAPGAVEIARPMWTLSGATVVQWGHLDRGRLTCRLVLASREWADGAELVATYPASGVIKLSRLKKGRAHATIELARGRIHLTREMLGRSRANEWPGVLAVATGDNIMLLNILDAEFEKGAGRLDS